MCDQIIEKVFENHNLKKKIISRNIGGKQDFQLMLFLNLQTVSFKDNGYCFEIKVGFFTLQK